MGLLPWVASHILDVPDAIYHWNAVTEALAWYLGQVLYAEGSEINISSIRSILGFLIVENIRIVKNFIS